MEIKIEKTIIDNKVIEEMIVTEKNYNDVVTLLDAALNIPENGAHYPLLLQFKNQIAILKTISDSLLNHVQNAVDPLVSEEQHTAYRNQRMQLIKAFFEVYKNYVRLFDEYVVDKNRNPNAYKNIELYIRQNSSSLLDLEGLLIQPVQRGPRYSLLVKETKKMPHYLTETNQNEFEQLEVLIKNSLSSINSALHNNTATKESYYWGKYSYETGLFVYSRLFPDVKSVPQSTTPVANEQSEQQKPGYRFGDGTRYVASLFFSSKPSSEEKPKSDTLTYS